MEQSLFSRLWPVMSLCINTSPAKEASMMRAESCAVDTFLLTLLLARLSNGYAAFALC